MCIRDSTQGLIHVGKTHGVAMQIATAVEKVNDEQKHVLVHRVTSRFGKDLKGRRFALWGLAFKPRTDDVREAPALTLISRLVEAGAEVRAHDPAARATARAALGPVADKVIFVDHPYDATVGADALVLVTEWQEYRSPDFERLRAQMRQRVLLDGRNIWAALDPEGHGFVYEGIGLGPRPGRAA